MRVVYTEAITEADSPLRLKTWTDHHSRSSNMGPSSLSFPEHESVRSSDCLRAGVRSYRHMDNCFLRSCRLTEHTSEHTSEHTLDGWLTGLTLGYRRHTEHMLAYPRDVGELRVLVTLVLRVAVYKRYVGLMLYLTHVPLSEGHFKGFLLFKYSLLQFGPSILFVYLRRFLETI